MAQLVIRRPARGFNANHSRATCDTSQLKLCPSRIMSLPSRGRRPHPVHSDPRWVYLNAPIFSQITLAKKHTCQPPSTLRNRLVFGDFPDGLAFRDGATRIWDANTWTRDRFSGVPTQSFSLECCQRYGGCLVCHALSPDLSTSSPSRAVRIDGHERKLGHDQTQRHPRHLIMQKQHYAGGVRAVRIHAPLLARKALVISNVISMSTVYDQALRGTKRETKLLHLRSPGYVAKALNP
ncbi:hypothetical protein BDW22DRAFT_1349358 [Trametopsis cervina]|nr:hypothetical protein BDW22DRAFT_1349358 [Trametopsis cervina]